VSVAHVLPDGLAQDVVLAENHRLAESLLHPVLPMLGSREELFLADLSVEGGTQRDIDAVFDDCATAVRRLTATATLRSQLLSAARHRDVVRQPAEHNRYH